MLEYFNNLSPDDVKGFHKFLQSPYFNTYSTMIRLFEYLKTHYPEIKAHHITGKMISRVIYNRAKYNNVRIRKLVSDFTDLMEKFLQQREYEKPALSNKILLLRSLRTRNMFKLYFKNIKEIKKIHKDEFSKDDEHYYEQIKFNNELMEIVYGKDRTPLTKLKILRSRNANYFFIYTNLVCYFQIISENIECEQKCLNFDQNMLKEVLKFTGKHLPALKKDHPGIVNQYNVLMMFLTFDDKYYEDNMIYYKKNRKKYSINLRRVFFMVAQHYLRVKINSNRGDFHGNNILAFKLNDLTFNKTDFFRSYLLEGRYLDGFLFLDILNNAFYLDKIKWLITFYNEYFKYINKDHANDCMNLYNAVLHISNKEFEKAMFDLNQISSVYSALVLESKMLFCISAFELRNFDILRSTIKNLNVYLRNTKNKNKLRLFRTSYFVIYMKKLILIFDHDNISINRELEKFRSELVKEENFIPYMKWFYGIK